MKLKPGLLLFAVALATVVVALKINPTRGRPESQEGRSSIASAPEVSTPDTMVAPVSKPSAAPHTLALPVFVASPVPPVQPPPSAAAANVSSPADAKQLLIELQQLGPEAPGVPITPEQADKFKQNIAELVRQGGSSVPAIREFLAKNIDSDFGDFSGGELLGYSSLRASLLDALTQIGGPDAQAAMVQALQTTAVPAEILELAKNLEQQAPGQYSEEIVKAAREAVEMSTANQLGTNVEVGPAFRILQNYSAFHPRALDDGNGGQKNGE